MDDRIAEALHRSTELGEIGVQVAAYVGQNLVVDEWIGTTERNGDELVDGDTLFPTQSVTKGFTGTCLHIQVDRGLVDYEAPVAEYWPEFGKNGKGGITVRHVLSHRSGVPAPSDLTFERTGDWEWMTQALADCEPLYPPGEKGAYQTLTYGYIVGEIVRRTDPKSRLPGAFIKDEINDPLGIDRFWLGLPDALNSEVATNYPAEGTRTFHRLTESALPSGYRMSGNETRPYRIPNPSGGAIMNPRSGARFWAMMANGGELDGVRVLSEERVRSLNKPRPVKYEYDEVTGFVGVLSDTGFWLGDDSPDAFAVIGNNPRVWSSPGAGGTVAWADPDLRMGAMICHNRMFSSYPPPKGDSHPFTALGEALREIAKEHG